MTLDEILQRIWSLNGESEGRIHKQQAETFLRLAYDAGKRDGAQEVHTWSRERSE